MDPTGSTNAPLENETHLQIPPIFGFHVNFRGRTRDDLVWIKANTDFLMLKISIHPSKNQAVSSSIMLMEPPILHFFACTRNLSKMKKQYQAWVIHLGDLCTLDRCKRSKNEHGECQNCLNLSSPAPCFMFPSPSFTWQNFRWNSSWVEGVMFFSYDMTIGFHDSHQLPYFLRLIFLPQSMEHSPSLSLRWLECWHNNNLLLFPCQFPRKNLLGGVISALEYGLGLEDPWWPADGVQQGRPFSLTITKLSLLVNLKGQGRLHPCPGVPMVFIVLSGDSWGL